MEKVTNKFNNFCIKFNLLKRPLDMTEYLDQVHVLCSDKNESTGETDTKFTLLDDRKLNEILLQASNEYKERLKIKYLNKRYWDVGVIKQIMHTESDKDVEEFCKKNKTKYIFRYIISANHIQIIRDHLLELKQNLNSDPIKYVKSLYAEEPSTKVMFTMKDNHFFKILFEFLPRDVYSHIDIFDELIKIENTSIVDMRLSPSENMKRMNEYYKSYDLSLEAVIDFNVNEYLSGSYQQKILKSLTKKDKIVKKITPEKAIMIFNHILSLHVNEC